MEEINDNAKTYVEGGNVFTVKREFEKGGASILEHIFAMLLDAMNKTINN